MHKNKVENDRIFLKLLLFNLVNTKIQQKKEQKNCFFESSHPTLDFLIFYPIFIYILVLLMMNEWKSTFPVKNKIIIGLKLQFLY